MAIGNKLKQLLDERKLTVKDFAQQIGVPPTTLYSLIKRDGQDIKMDLLMKICNGLEINLDELIYYQEEYNNKHADEHYYINDETRKIAQEVFENPELRALFKVARDIPPERLRAHIEFMKSLKNQEKGNSDDPC